MKIRLFIIIIMLIAFYPFIGGNKGCGGAIEFGGDMELAGEGVEPDESISIDTAVPGPEGEVLKGETPEGQAASGESSGAENILKSKPEEKEELDKVGARPPECATFLPADMDVYIVEDAKLDEKSKKSLEEFGLLDRLEYLTTVSMKLLDVKEGMIPPGMKSVGAACKMSKEKIDNLAKQGARLLDCDEFAIASVFEKDFEMIDLVAVNADGNYVINDKIRVYKPAERVLVVASANMQEKNTIDEKQRISLGMASPSTFVVMGKSEVIRALQADPVVQLFMPMYLKAGFEFPAEIISALDFNENVRTSSLVSEDGEDVMKIYMELPYEEYAFAIKKIADQVSNAERATATETTPTLERAPSATTIERSSIEIGADTIKGEATPSSTTTGRSSIEIGADTIKGEQAPSSTTERHLIERAD